MEKIKVKNNSSGEVGYTLSNSNIRRSWLPHQTLNIALSELEEGFYEPGIKVLFTSGMLFIESIEDRKLCGLAYEADDEVVDDAAGTYSREEILKALKNSKTGDLAVILRKAKPSVHSLIVSLAIENEITDGVKVNLIKDTTGTDVMEAIQNLKRLDS